MQDDHSKEEAKIESSNDLTDLEMSTVDSAEEAKIYHELLQQVPVPWLISKMRDIQDFRSATIITASPAYEKLRKVSLQDITGKLLSDVVPYVLDDDAAVLRGVYETAMTGKTIYLEPQIVDADQKLRTGRMKHMALPNHCVITMLELPQNLEAEVKQRKEEAQRQMEGVVDKFLNLMLVQQEDGTPPRESWQARAIRGVISFGDGNNTNFQIDHEPSHDGDLISAADIGTLIRNLSEAKDGYVEQFLITYRYFITPKALLNKLILKYISASGESGKAVRESLLKVFRTWIKEHYYDFDNDAEVMQILKIFVNEHAKNLRKLLTRRTSSLTCNEITQMPELSRKATKLLQMFKRKSKLSDFDATAVAQQLTLLSFSKFQQIKPIELHSQSWSKEAKAETSPNVVALVDHFNRIVALLAYEVLSQPKINSRVAALEHVISVGWAAYGYRDYETTFIVFTSLSQFAIDRLSETWKLLPYASREQWDKISQFCAYNDNYRTYRSQLKKDVNMMPYVGLFLRDLTFIEENNTINDAGAVNFYKMRKVAQVITTIQRAQQSIFHFSTDLRVLSYISFEVPVRNEKELWKMSVQCEKGTDTMRGKNHKRLGDRLSSSELVTTSSNPIFGLSHTSPVKGRERTYSR